MTFTLFLDLLAAGLITGGIYAIVAIGLNLQYGLMRVMNIAHGEFLMLGAYLTYVLHTTLGLNPLATLPLSMAALFLVGLLVHRLVLRRLVHTSPNTDVFEARGLVASFGLMFVVQNLALMVWGADLRGYTYLAEPLELGGVIMPQNRLLVFGVVVLLSAGLIAALRFTLIGKAIRAMMQAPLGAQLVGIDTARLHPYCFGAGLALAGVAGALLSMVYEISPGMGEPYTITALIVITLGGYGSIVGSLAAGLLLGLVETFGMHFTSPSLKMVLSYAVFIGVLMFKPKGLFAK